MIPSMFGTKKVDRSPVFTEDDIRKLILSFPPPEPRPGKESLVRSLSGRNLVRSDAVIKRFHSLLQSATGPVFLNSLHNELGVHEVQWLLTQEDERIHYSTDRRRLLPESIQIAIFQSVHNQLASSGVELDSIASEKDITVTTLRRILAAQDANLVLKDLEDGKTYDSKFLQKLETDIKKNIEDAQETVVLSETYTQVPISWLESAAQSFVSTDDNNASGVVEVVSGRLRFTPKSQLVQLQGELKQAQNAYIFKAVAELERSGYVEVTISSRPQILQNAEDVNLTRAIREAIALGDDSLNIVELSTPQSSFLISQDALSAKRSIIAARAADAASEQWSSRHPGEEVTFDPTSLPTSNDTSAPLDQAILSSGDPEDTIASAFSSRILSLQTSTHSTFVTTIQSELLAPLKLYTIATDTISDSTLQPRVQEFVHDYVRKELTPQVLLTIKHQNLITTKSVSRDVDKFSEAVTAARTLQELNTATAKLARKQKIETPSAPALRNRKCEILMQKMAAMNKMKRSSDLLQNAIWILLAKGREGLYMSSGKDTSRMIKMVREGDVEAARKLEEWKDVVKQGKDTEDTKREMRQVAAEAIEEWKAASVDAALGEETSSEQVKEEQTTTT
ncbi:hypothetical protein M436DRAFT_52131 [Aureobasidium namibiae CBS 147.97]|uniref:Uncharacterized protein n=1 Tax=Aureobasidium namibiae CBS 147.97 TaxID=1043004 RepID=A0A074X992_9PEZI